MAVREMFSQSWKLELEWLSIKLYNSINISARVIARLDHPVRGNAAGGGSAGNNKARTSAIPVDRKVCEASFAIFQGRSVVSSRKVASSSLESLPSRRRKQEFLPDLPEIHPKQRLDLCDNFSNRIYLFESLASNNSRLVERSTG